MVHAAAIAHRFDQVYRHVVERCQTLLLPACRALATAWTAPPDERLRTEMSDHMLRDMGVSRDDIRGAERGLSSPH